jgi:carboxyl-terminal processing protease
MRYYVTLIVIIGLFFRVSCFAQSDFAKQKTELILKKIEKYHYQSRQIDDDFSALLYKQFIDNLDVDRTIFTKEAMALIDVHENMLDDYLTNGDFSFIDQITEVYNSKIGEKLIFLDKLSQMTIDFSIKDSIVFYENPLFLNIEQLEEKWEKLIRFYALRNYFGKNDSLSKSSKNDIEQIIQIQQEFISREGCSLKLRQNKSVNGIGGYVAEAFVKALATTFDPHTVYLSPTENNRILTSLSTQSLSFGLELYSNEYGELEIYNIIPGSPAWHSHKLNEGDVIEAIHPDKKEKMEVSCEQLLKVVNEIYTEEKSSVQFFVRKKSGKKVNVELVNAAIDVEDNIIRSFVLDGNSKVGYIYLPSFYTNFSDYNADGGCANDVAKEIVKLKREGIKGLVFDLRNNGGGGMQEAINMAGIFVNYGALSIAAYKDQAITLKDMNRGTIFNNPVVVLQNRYSASASELFSAAMQDYNRAVIVGSPSFGKSTIQNIMPLCENENASDEEVENGGYIKLTIGKFYRIDGTTHQIYGVVPDIYLPDWDNADSIGEKAYPTALGNDTINKKVYAYPLIKLPLDTLRILSQQRIGNSDVFNGIQEYATSDSKTDFICVPLEMEDFMNYYKNKSSEYPKEEYTDSVAVFQVNNPKYLQGYSSVIDSNKVVNESVINDIKSDVYIKEAYLVLNDLIEIQNKP